MLRRQFGREDGRELAKVLRIRTDSDRLSLMSFIRSYFNVIRPIIWFLRNSIRTPLCSHASIDYSSLTYHVVYLTLSGCRSAVASPRRTGTGFANLAVAGDVFQP